MAEACVSAGTYVVHDNVERAKVRRNTLDRILDCLVVADVELHGQGLGLVAVLLGNRMQLVGDRVDRAGERLVGLGTLGRNRDIGAPGSERLGDLGTDSTRGSGTG